MNSAELIKAAATAHISFDTWCETLRSVDRSTGLAMIEAALEAGKIDRRDPDYSYYVELAWGQAEAA